LPGQSGGWAFQLCSAAGCSGGFVRAPSTTWAQFIEGAPVRPGDGISIIGSGDFSGTFTLAAPLSLKSNSGGLTVSVFAPGVTHLSVDLIANKAAPCNVGTTIGLGGTNITPWTVNGITGVLGQLSQAALDGAVNTAIERAPSCGLVVGDFSITKLGVYSTTSGVISILDGASFGLGQGVVPTP